MADDWGEEAAGDWGEEAADDWGDAGGDDWGDAPAGGDDWGDAPADEQHLSPAEKIANALYEAEFALEDTSPDEAIQMFQKVLTLSETEDNLPDESHGVVFKSMRHIVSLNHKLNNTEAMKEAFDKLLHYIPHVTRNEAQDTLNQLVTEVSAAQNEGALDALFQQMNESLRKMPDQQRLWFRMAMKYAETLYAANKIKASQKMLEELLNSCRDKDGNDDLTKGAELLEIYALDSKMSLNSQDSKRLKVLYEKTKNLEAAVKDPKSQSVIRECWGQMFGNQGQWKAAYAEFFLAFTNYLQIGARESAVRCLKYYVIAHMLSGQDSNPFSAQESKGLQTDPEIIAMDSLRKGYDESDVQLFSSSLETVLKDRDQFIYKHLQNIIFNFRKSALLKMVLPYSRVRISYLAQVLKMKSEDVESMLVQLILDSELAAKIDQMNGLVDLQVSGIGGGAKYASIDGWTASLRSTVNFNRN